MRERERENFWPVTQSSHELILAAKASNGGGHCSCSTDTTPDRGSGWPRPRGSGGVPVRARGHRGHSVGALRGRQSPELIRRWASELRANLLCRSRDFLNEMGNGMDDYYRLEAQFGILGTSSSLRKRSWATRSRKHAKSRHENDALRHDQPLEASPGRV